MTVKVVAIGSGNQEQGGAGACCTAFSRENLNGRLFFDVLHPQWDRKYSPSNFWSSDEDLTRTAAHEYAHIWQSDLGCISLFFQPLGDWLNEGIAEYIAHQALSLASSTTVRQWMISTAMYVGSADIPLDELEINSAVWPGHIGYLAVEWLVDQAPGGLQSLVDVCTKVGSGSSADEAFEQAFGIYKADFYNEVSGGQLVD